MQEPDPQVIRAAARGDLVAFEELMRAYQAQVWRFLRHLVADPALAEDLTQETFLRVHRRLGTFRYQSKFSTWLFQIARNAGIDALRSRERRNRLLTVVPPPSSSVADGAARVEIDGALASLTPKLRECFVLVEVFGFTHREVAETLGIPEGTAKTRVFRARAQLLEWLRAGEGEADAL